MGLADSNPELSVHTSMKQTHVDEFAYVELNMQILLFLNHRLNI